MGCTESSPLGQCLYRNPSTTTKLGAKRRLFLDVILAAKRRSPKIKYFELLYEKLRYGQRCNLQSTLESLHGGSLKPPGWFDSTAVLSSSSTHGGETSSLVTDGASFSENFHLNLNNTLSQISFYVPTGTTITFAPNRFHVWRPIFRPCVLSSQIARLTCSLAGESPRIASFL